MHGDHEIIFSLAGRMHVALRREINRIIDVEWCCSNAAYAGEIIKVARSSESEELSKLADRMEQVHPLFQHAEQKRTVEAISKAAESQYIRTLR
jgi:hypothetical protein